MRYDWSGGKAKDGTPYLEGEDASGICAAAKRWKIEGMRHAAYESGIRKEPTVSRKRVAEAIVLQGGRRPATAAFGTVGDTASGTAGQEEAAECPPEGTRAVQGIEEGGRGDKGGRLRSGQWFGLLISLLVSAQLLFLAAALRPLQSMKPLSVVVGLGVAMQLVKD